MHTSWKFGGRGKRHKNLAQREKKASVRPCFQREAFKPDSGMGRTIAVDVTL